MARFLESDEHLMYLRKSRQDNPAETVEEVLAKHEQELQEMAERELGARIPEHCIFREIVSGETIDERPKMLRLLSEIENPKVKMVWCVEPSRLSRGDLEDCGKVVNAFRYSRTEIKTRRMEYDLSNKMHRKFFEQELMSGNDFLEFTKEILLQGRIAAVKKGAYIGNVAPWGYKKAKISGLNSLEPDDNADAVKLIFDLYVNQDMTFLEIARKLDSMGIKPMKSDQWEKCSIKNMIKNDHYAGYVHFGAKKTEKVYENGQLVKKRNIPAPEETITAKGVHQALVSQEIFDAAQAKMNNHPRVRPDKTLKNPLAGICVCSMCGRNMIQHPYKNAKTRIECRYTTCKGSKSAILDEVVDAVAYVLETEKLPELEVKLKSNEGNSLKIQQRNIEKMNEELEALYKTEERLFTFLENGTYSEETFLDRQKVNNQKIEEQKAKIFEAKKTLPKEVDYAERIVTLKEAIKGLRDDALSPTAKNKLLKAIVERIEYEFLNYEGRGKVRYRLHIHLLC